MLEVAEEYAKGMQRIQDENISSIDKLKKLITLHIQIASKNSNGMAIVQKDWMHLEEDLAYYKQLRRDYESKFHQIIDEDKANKEHRRAHTETNKCNILTT